MMSSLPSFPCQPFFVVTAASGGRSQPVLYKETFVRYQLGNYKRFICINRKSEHNFPGFPGVGVSGENEVYYIM